MSNLLKETVEYLTWVHKTTDDVRWVGSHDGKYAMSWDEFALIADIEYDAGYGGQEIASDLVVVGDDWWFTRSEYDGSEGWRFNTKPYQEAARKFTHVKDPDGAPWATLEDMHKPGGKYGGLWNEEKP